MSWYFLGHAYFTSTVQAIWSQLPANNLLLVAGDLHMAQRATVCDASAKCVPQLIASGITQHSTAMEDRRLLVFFYAITQWLQPLACLWGQEPVCIRSASAHYGQNYACVKMMIVSSVSRSLWNGSSWLVLLVLVVLGGVDADVVACAGTMCSCSGAFACSYDTTASVCQCTFPQAITIGLVAAVLVFGAVWYVRAYKMRKRKDTLRKAKSTAKMVQISQTGRQAQQEINPASKWHMAGPPPQNFNSIAPQ
ncbi:hypothetical protein DYB25_003255 [Aphanomyces astaci]|uniref:PhoD-like phosphatase metallophosphatase domain-containing protein n=1 Tax=Aphanomyces astaci TaxID=112090 RepID=A0A397E4V9_APHAT|nr:hypothetical protein DYB36_001049 [Aphanomyces astaci]RHY17870.1 hypothetical protein DYB25_003255 [Aphanomyces astaci]RHY75679.1 hypothetical protein DYB38_005884 [Aphanomyces astaci]RHY81715.1 hypothetical protein DYB31_002132 [Aphanomyces astaci]